MCLQTSLILVAFGTMLRSKMIPNGAQDRSQTGPKSIWIAFLLPGAVRHLVLNIWSRFGTALGGHVGAKIGLGSDLESLRKEKSNLIPFRSRFWTHFEWFWTPHRRSKGRSKQQGNDYCRSFKIIDFPKGKTLFLLLREMSYSLKNKFISLS